jgi:hypothetical protein
MVLAACGRTGETPAPTAASGTSPVCRPNPERAERGLGGTGVSAGDLQTAERGLGGTGIVGVITGFASICINDVEIAYDPETPAFVEGRRVTMDQLRVGQVVAIDSIGREELHARKVSIIYQASGQIGALTGSAEYGVSGQRIRLAESAKLPMDAPLRPGDWVNVSGFRSPDGVISATRIDRRDPGPVTVRGRLTGVPGNYHIGDLTVRPPPGAMVASGQWVIAEGSYDNGVLAITVIGPDLVASDPTALFGPNTTRFLIEGYSEAINGRIVSGSGWSVPAPPQSGLGTSPGRLSVIDFQRAPDGSLLTSGFRALPSPLGIPGGPPANGQPQQPPPGTSPFGGILGKPTGGPGYGGTIPGGLPGSGGVPMGGGRPGR